MMRNTTHKILILPALLALAACSDSELEQTLSGEGKTPLAMTAVLDVNKRAVQSRAADKDFAAGDEMVAYLRHVKWNGGFTTASEDQREVVTADEAPLLVTLTASGSEAWNSSINDILPFDAAKDIAINSANTKQASGLSVSYTGKSGSAVNALYWDDLSVSTDDGEKDLRTEGHYIQSFYGFCYNGGTPSTALGADETHKTEDGVIGWTILTDQSGTTDPTNFKKSDLLWSGEQTPVSYTHRDANQDNQRPGLVIPYTHAMSKVTIKVTAGIGFDSNYSFDDTAITLEDVRTTCTATAPTATLTYPTDGTGKADVKMQPQTITTAGTRAFSAIIVPSVLTVGNTFATITGMDGNTYAVPVTESIIKDGGGWGAQLDNTDEDVNNGTAQSRPRQADATVPKGKGHQMRSGVHYVLNVTLNKTSVNVSATITDWDEVEAEGVGEIHFSNDITDTGFIAEALRENGFDVYKSADKTNFGTAATTMRWNKTSSVWKYYPTIYWQGGTSEYFRALSNVKPDLAGTPTTNESLTMENGRDALWGTTEAHSGTDADGDAYNYQQGGALKPRTGDVPLVFYHAMSKVTFYLVDALKDNTDPLARLDLSKATIQFTNLATGGTLDLAAGSIAPASITAGQKTFSEDPGAVPARMGFYAAKENGNETTYASDLTVRDYPVIPQAIGNDAQIIITLADGSRYIAQLNLCKVKDSSTPILQWERGKHYIYEIILGKETITFRALIEKWDDVEGGGKATLEWD